MSEIIRLQTADYEEAMDFMNLVFSLGGAPTNFPHLLPKLYKPDDHLLQYNYAIKHNNKIRAVVGSFPLQLSAGGEILKVAGIGGVSTHPGERRTGLMRKLMEAAVSDMDQDGCDLSVLGGQRQRYGYYGYEKGGSILSFHLTKTNLRHTLRGQEPPDVSFHCIAAAPDSKHTPDSLFDQNQTLMDTVAWMHEAHAAQPVFLRREKADFLTILTSWNCSVWVACEKQLPAGYMVINPNGSVSEFITTDNGCAQNIAAAWLQQHSDEELVIQVQPSQTKICVQMAQICEYWHLDLAYMYRIMNWPRVLKAMLQVKAGQMKLPDGSLSFWLKDQEKGFSLSLKNGQVTASWLDNDHDNFTLKLDRLTAARLVTGPLPAAQVLTGEQLSGANEQLLLSSWFPLPFGWPMPDGV